jgi:hypothetical protein
MEMKSKLINFLVIITSLAGYLEWGGNNHSFLFQAEGEILVKAFINPASALHPFILMPMTGQALLVFTLFQKTPNKFLTYTGIAGLGILLVFMCIIGIFSANLKILSSTIPFMVVAVIAVRHYNGKEHSKIL